AGRSGLDLDRDELLDSLAFAAGFPGVAGVLEGVEQAGVQAAAVLPILDHLRLDVVEADALEPMHSALEVPALLAVELQEGAGVLHDLLVGRHLAQVLRDLGLDAAVAADVELVAGI